MLKLKAKFPPHHTYFEPQLRIYIDFAATN